MDDEWYLAEANLVYYSICDYIETFTYDLLTLSGYHSKQKDECNESGAVIDSQMEIEETLVLTGGKDLPLMNGFLPGDISVEVEGNMDGYRY